MKKFSIYFLLSITVALVIFSCKKENEKKIEGNWLEVETRNLKNDSIFEEWYFNDNVVLFLKYHRLSQLSDTLYKADYKIKANPFRRKLIIENSTQPEYEGEWSIEKLNNKYLVLTLHKGGLLYKEFQKK